MSGRRIAANPDGSVCQGWRFRRQAGSYEEIQIIPTLCVGMQARMLCVQSVTQSVTVGTIT